MDKPHVKLEFQEPDPQRGNATQLPAILGLIKSQANVPTGKPRSFYEQFRIVSGAFWFYDTLTNLWHDAAAGSATPGGSTGDIQVNASGAFQGDSDFRWLAALKTLIIGSANPALYPVITLTQLAQASYIFTRVGATTNATPATIHVYNLGSDGQMVMIEARVSARRTGGSSGTTDDSAAYVRRAAFKRTGGTVTQIGSTQDDFTVEDQGGWDVTFAISGVDVLIQVTGATNNNVSWHATILEQTQI